MSEKEIKDEKDLLSASASGASYLVLLQFISRILTFTLNQLIYRYVSMEAFGIASVNLDLLSSTILFISREGFRSALIRSNQGRQTILNLAYIPTFVGLVITTITCTYAILQLSNQDLIQFPLYRVAILLYGSGSFLELMSEPFYIYALNQLLYGVRVKVEGLAVLVRCLTTFILTVYFQQDRQKGILAFGLAQFFYGCVMVLGFVGYFWYKEKSIYDLLPKKTSSGYWFEPSLLNLGITMTKQSVLKHILTEGDKMLISVLSTTKDRGAYALVVNYGSLIARILFQPLEEIGRTFFSKLLLENKEKKNEKTAIEMLYLLIRFQVILGFIFICFATNYTDTLFGLILSKSWTEGGEGGITTADVLAMYCVYVPFLGINGITEGFVQAVATKEELSRLSYFMILFSGCFMISGYFFMHILPLGAIGLILANMVNLGIRIFYSWYFIQGYFTKKVSIRACFPDNITSISFILSWIVTWSSKHYIGWYTFKQKIYHICVGGITFLLVTIIMYWREKEFIKNIKNIRHRKLD